MNDFKIYCPSWKRADRVITHKYLPDALYVVAESQAEAYKANGLPVWVCPDSAQGNLCRVRNWILDNVPTKQVLILDDDLRGLGQWEGSKRRKLTTDEAMDFLSVGFQVAGEAGVKFWGVNPMESDKQAYRESNPFSLSAYIGGPFQAFIDCPLRYDEALPLKEDYDMTLQVLNRYRKVFRFNMIHYHVDQHGMPGGCADYRNIPREREQFDLLQCKWGSSIVRRDEGKSRDKGRVKVASYDINPIIKVPIKGV